MLRMRPALALVGLMMAGYLQAEVPMDLNSPFVQTLLLREKTGEVSEQSVRKGRAKGEVLEFEKAEGGLLVLPRTQVIALLPRLPQPGAAYLQSDAQRALKVLEAVQATFSQRPEAGADAVAAGTYFCLRDQNPLQARSHVANAGVPIRMGT